MRREHGLQHFLTPFQLFMVFLLLTYTSKTSDMIATAEDDCSDLLLLRFVGFAHRHSGTFKLDCNVIFFFFFFKKGGNCFQTASCKKKKKRI